MRLSVSIICFLILIFSCKKEALNYQVRFTVLNAVPDAASFEIYVGAGKVEAPSLFGIPDYYISTPAVTDSLKWKISSQSKIDVAVLTDLPNGADFTLLFFDSASRYKSYLVKDEWQQPASEKQGYIRFFPMIVNANALKITNDTGKSLIVSRSFGDFFTNNISFTAIDSFATKLRLYNNNVLIDSLPNSILLPGKTYTIYATGILNATGSKRPKMIFQEHHN